MKPRRNIRPKDGIRVADYYGRQLTPEPVMSSIGPVVDLDIEGEAEFFRFSPTEAINLGKALQKVGEEQKDGA